MPATSQLNDLDFEKVSKLLNVLVDPRSSDDTGLATGQQWFNTSEDRTKGYDGTTVFTLMRLDGDDTITGIFNFNPASGTVPFTVDATKNSLVTNLNADRVDGYHGSKAATVDTLAVRDTGGVLTVATPTADGHAATKAYVDNLAAGQDWKDSCLAATTGNITLSGEQTIDGVSVVTGDRVLVKNQTDASENGLFVADSGAWSRTDDADQDAEVTSGLTVFIEEGTTNGGTGWTLTTSGTIVVGTTDLTFTPTSGGSAYTAGNGLVKVGTVFHFGSDSAYSVGNVPYCDGSDSINFVSAGASGTVLKGNGAASPTFGAVDLTADVTGILPPANGGTGSVALTQFSVPVVGAAGVFTEDTSGFKYGTTYGQLAVDCVIVGDDSSYESSNFGSILAVASGSRFSGEIQLFNSILAGGSSSNTRVIVMSRSAGISTTSSFLGFDLAMDVTSSTLGAGSAHCFDLDLEYSHTVDGSTVAMRGIVLKPNISGASRTVSTYSGVYSYLNIAGSGSVFTNAYHFRADLDTAMATTEYGVYIGGTPGSNTYAFYNDTTAVSYFGGNVGIGTTTPNEQLEITGNFRFPSTTSTAGIVYQEGNRLLHTFQHLTGSTAVPIGRNIFLGDLAGNFTTGSTATATYHGSYNIGIGCESMQDLTFGGHNVGVGSFTFRELTEGFYNSAFGSQAGQSLIDGNRNAFFGYQSGYLATSGNSNSGLGSNTLRSLTTGNHNVAVGTYALDAITTSNGHVGVGYLTLSNLTSGSYSIAIGYTAGAVNSVGGSLLNSDYGIFIGYAVSPVEGSTKETIIGYDVDGNGSNTMTLGGVDQTDVYLTGQAHVSILNASSSDSVVTENAGVLEKRTIDSRAWSGGGLVDGSGTTNYIPKFSDSNTLTDSGLSDDGAIIATSRYAYFNSKPIYGGFGSHTTGGTLDWNDSTNCRSGNSQTLLLGNATNGPAGGTYYHSFSFEYQTKNATGNITQFAIPYGISSHVNQGIYYRGINGTTKSATSWSEIWTSDTDGAGSGLDADLLDGQQGSWFQDLANSTGDTDDIAEGSVNLYYTDTRARAALSSEAATEIAYNSGTGAIGLGTEAARVKSGTIGDAASTSITFTHSLNTRDVVVQVYRNSSPYDTVLCDIERNSTSQVTLSFNTAPGTNEYAVVVTAANG